MTVFESFKVLNACIFQNSRKQRNRHTKPKMATKTPKSIDTIKLTPVNNNNQPHKEVPIFTKLQNNELCTDMNKISEVLK